MRPSLTRALLPHSPVWLPIALTLAMLLGMWASVASSAPSKAPALAPRFDATQASLTVLSPAVTIVQGATGTAHVGVSGELLAAGDRVTTDATGTALITFFDGSELEMDVQTEILLNELGQSAAGGGLVALSQAAGVTVNRVTQLGDTSSYQLSTPSATALVRGTVFRGKVVRDPTTRAVTEEDIGVDEGAVNVSTKVVSQTLTPGQRLTIIPGPGGLTSVGQVSVQSGVGPIQTSRESGTAGSTQLAFSSVDGVDRGSINCGAPGGGNSCHFGFGSPVSGTLDGRPFQGEFTSTFTLRMADTDGLAGLAGQNSDILITLTPPESGSIRLLLSSGPTDFTRISSAPLAWRGTGDWTASGGHGILGGQCFGDAEGSGVFTVSRIETDGTRNGQNALQMSLSGDLNLTACSGQDDGNANANTNGNENLNGNGNDNTGQEPEATPTPNDNTSPKDTPTPTKEPTASPTPCHGCSIG